MTDTRREMTIAELWARAITDIVEIERRELKIERTHAADVLPDVLEAASRSTEHDRGQKPYTAALVPYDVSPQAVLGAAAALAAMHDAREADDNTLARKLEEYAEGLLSEGRHRGPQWMREAADRLKRRAN